MNGNGKTSAPFRLKVWGRNACFTRPEMKVERVSYDVMTPSAARGVLEAILWKPAIRWLVERIDVEGDRRAYRVRLTAKGRKQFHEMARQHEGWILQAFSGLTDKEVATLHRLLGKVKEHATQANLEAAA